MTGVKNIILAVFKSISLPQILSVGLSDTLGNDQNISVQNKNFGPLCQTLSLSGHEELQWVYSDTVGLESCGGFAKLQWDSVLQ